MLPVVDTVKRVRDGLVVETLDREELGGGADAAGLPLRAARRGLRGGASATGVTVTDEAMAVERLGAPVRAVPGSPRNRKITTPEDLAWAEGVLAGLVRA